MPRRPAALALLLLAAACADPGLAAAPERPAGTPEAGADERRLDDQAELSWDAPTTRIDGTPLDDLVGFRIYYGPAANPLANVIEIDDPSARKAIVDLDGGPGTYYFTVTAVDRMGRESGFSQQVSKTID